MSKKVYNIVYPREGSGAEKRTFWEKQGIMVIETAADGTEKINIRLDSIPVGNKWDGWLKAFPREDKEGRAPAAAGPDDAPF